MNIETMEFKITAKEIKTHFDNGHRCIEGVKNGRCQFCGLAQTYWTKWVCERIYNIFKLPKTHLSKLQKASMRQHLLHPE